MSIFSVSDRNFEEDPFKCSPTLHNVRADDVDTYDERNGIVMVAANRKGISLIYEARLKRIEKVAAR